MTLPRRTSSWSSRTDPMRLFGTLRAMEARSLAGPVVDIEAPAGTILVREGAVIGTFYLVRSGTAELRRGDSAVGSLGPGDCFGELDPMSGEPQRYSVVATSSLRLMAFSAVGIGRLCDAVPGARERILDSLHSQGAEIHPLPRTNSAADASAPVRDAAGV